MLLLTPNLEAKNTLIPSGGVLRHAAPGEEETLYTSDITSRKVDNE